MSNSSLVSYTRLSPNCTKMSNKVNKKITIHHMAGNLSVETCGSVFCGSRQASANYGIGSDGRIGLYVNECDRSWASCSKANDSQAVTIEVANNSGAPNWTVSDKAYASLINLCEDICRRNGIKSLNFTGDATGNLTMHSYFAATACPGPYLKARFKNIATEVNNRLKGAATKIEPIRDESIPIKGYYHCTKGRSVRLSKNFVSSEFDCHGSGCCKETVIDEDLVKYLQKIRDHFGRAVNISSGYRCAKHSKAIGGATNSKHTYGMAADISVSGISPAEVAKYAESIGILGIGLYDTAADGHFVHIDTRATKSFWYGQAQAYRSTFGGGNATDSSTILCKGDKGDRVKKLQKNLITLGYSVGMTGADGRFGSSTEQAVKKFQRAMRITADGVVGKVTSDAITAALNKQNDNRYGLSDFVTEVQKIVGISKPDGIAGPVTLSKTVTISQKINSTHALVKPIQKRLYAMGYTEVGKVDGVAGSKFTKAVKRLQKEKGKLQDGEITKGQTTWKILLGMI